MKTHRFKVTNTHLFKMKTHRFKVTNTHLFKMTTETIILGTTTHILPKGKDTFEPTVPKARDHFLPLEFKVMGLHQIKTMATHQLLMTTSYLRMVNRCPIDAASKYLHNIICNGAIAKIPCRTFLMKTMKNLHNLPMTVNEQAGQTCGSTAGGTKMNVLVCLPVPASQVAVDRKCGDVLMGEQDGCLILVSQISIRAPIVPVAQKRNSAAPCAPRRAFRTHA